LELVGREPDLTLAEIEERLLKDRGVRTTDSSIDRFFKRHKISFKKNAARSRTRSARRRRGQEELQSRPSRA
jgi:transposase